jgi:hypothetical protein
LQHISDLNISTMCYHRRTVYACNHFAWGDVFNPCETEKKFDGGEANVGCSRMWSHGMCTNKVKTMCKDCAKDKTEIATKLGAVKEAIKKLRENLDGRVEKRDLPELPTLSTLDTFKVPELDIESEDDMANDSDLEVMSQVAVDDIKEPVEASLDADLLPATEEQEEESVKEEETEVTTDPKILPLYLPILVTLPEGMRQMILDKVAR